VQGTNKCPHETDNKKNDEKTCIPNAQGFKWKEIKVEGSPHLSKFSTADSKFVLIVRWARMVSAGDNGFIFVRASEE
jgi:hypothetical protein